MMLASNNDNLIIFVLFQSQYFVSIYQSFIRFSLKSSNNIFQEIRYVSDCSFAA